MRINHISCPWRRTRNNHFIISTECSLSNKNGGDIFETGHEVFDCTNTTCPLDGSQHVWRIDLGKDTAVSGLTIERRVKGTIHNYDVVFFAYFHRQMT